MITEKDRELIKDICGCINIPIGISILNQNVVSAVFKSNAVGDIEQDELLDIISRIRAESADQARKEAAEIAVEFVDNNLMGISECDIGLLSCLRAAILSATVNEVKTDAENNRDDKYNDIIDRAKNVGGNYYEDVLFLCTEIAKLSSGGKLAIAVKALKWALEYIGDGFLPEEGTPDHECGYTTAPDTGYCEFCENYWIAREALKEIQ